ncbi:MAG: CCA tRNA nucleotidyltransferase [Candidatus Aenigmarchaeota archaeon]|nr:CCA tRNA nucleotidyltransferase [Candidatus Aenigmarchaeota archaeon]
MDILSRIKPSKKEEKETSEKIKKIIDKIKIKDTKIMLGGSGAKGTFLKDTHDADIFVKFNYKKYKDKSDQLSSILEKRLKKAFPRVIKLHGSRDYFQIKKSNFTFEIIPILDISKAEQAKNITDISPLHVKWVNKNTNQKLKDEIRIAKAFCKAQNVYGAESHIRGFSGYSLEILTIYYKSFNNLIKNASKWKPKQVIDPKHYHKNALNELNQAKIEAPLVLVDPVQPDRNATAALSEEKYKNFISASKAYLKNKSQNFFIKKEIDINKLKKRKGYLLLLEVTPLAGKEDVVGCKLVKALNYLKKHLTLEGYNVLDCNWEWNKKVLFWFLVENNKLPKYKIHYGPPIYAKENLKKFKAKHKKIYINKTKSYTKIQRKYTEMEDFIKNFIRKDNNIKNKAKKIEVIKC